MSTNVNLPTYVRRGLSQWHKRNGTWWVSPVVPAVFRNNNVMNEITHNYFGNKNIAYQVKRGGIYVYYFPNTLRSLLRQQNRRRHVNNLNYFLNQNASITNNTVLFKDPQTRRNVKLNNIKKVKLRLPRNMAARVIQKARHKKT